MMPETQNDEGLLERLKRIQAKCESNAASENGAESALISRDFGQLARIALTMARTECIKADNLDKLALLRDISIVPDDVIPDAHKSEVGLTNFIRSNLPEEEWPKFLGPQDSE